MQARGIKDHHKNAAPQACAARPSTHRRAERVKHPCPLVSDLDPAAAAEQLDQINQLRLLLSGPIQSLQKKGQCYRVFIVADSVQVHARRYCKQRRTGRRRLPPSWSSCSCPCTAAARRPCCRPCCLAGVGCASGTCCWILAGSISGMGCCGRAEVGQAAFTWLPPAEYEHQPPLVRTCTAGLSVHRMCRPGGTPPAAATAAAACWSISGSGSWPPCCSRSASPTPRSCNAAAPLQQVAQRQVMGPTKHS